ncbi:STAS domain-containing protein [Streptomyces sp. NPDC048462]|uniref:STAS domain-containing protein n=1 Tax=Streptomyces sp. NPDC048462 TaxID=3365555 RepID=UPI00371D8DC4
MNARRERVLNAAVWLTVTGAAVWAGIVTEPYWLQFACLVAAAAALRLALRALWAHASHISPGMRFGEGRAVVRLSDDLTPASADKAARRLTEALDELPSVLEIDLSKVSTLGKDTTQVLFTGLRAAAERGVRVRVTGANRRVRTTLHGMGLDRFFRYTHAPDADTYQDRR